MKNNLKKKTLSIMVLLICSTSTQTNAAACTSGTSDITLGSCTTPGQWEYSTADNTYMFCDGTNYISLNSSVTNGSCSGTQEGTLEYNTSDSAMEFCNGTDWVVIANASSSGSCSDEGQIDYNTSSNTLELCAGGTINTIKETLSNEGSLSVTGDTGLYWTSTHLGSFDSGAQTHTYSLTVTNTGDCDQNITSVSATPTNDCATGVFTFCGGSTPGFAIMDSSTCSGAIASGATCTLDMTAQIIIPAGGYDSTSGTLTINTSTITKTQNLLLSGCDEVGANAQSCS